MTDCIMAREYDGGVVAIDSGLMRPEMVACYLLESDGHVAIIETGNRASAGRILQVLERRGWSRDAVSHVIVTHVHLDHAGGAGALLQALPSARLVVHPRGARHLVDPSRLEAGTRAVYGDAAFEAMHGVLIPVAEDRVVTMGEGGTVMIGGRELCFIDTPGHARHHFCIWDEATRGWFTGDTFGISYRDLDTERGALVFPTTTPTQFDPDALIASVRRLLQRDPRYVYLTHFGRVGDVARLGESLVEAVRLLQQIGERHAGAAARTELIRRDMLRWMLDACRSHGVQLSDADITQVLMDDVVLNTQGIESWLDQRAQ